MTPPETQKVDLLVASFCDRLDEFGFTLYDDAVRATLIAVLELVNRGWSSPSSFEHALGEALSVVEALKAAVLNG